MTIPGRRPRKLWVTHRGCSNARLGKGGKVLSAYPIRTYFIIGSASTKENLVPSSPLST